MGTHIEIGKGGRERPQDPVGGCGKYAWVGKLPKEGLNDQEDFSDCWCHGKKGWRVTPEHQLLSLAVPFLSGAVKPDRENFFL